MMSANGGANDAVVGTLREWADDDEEEEFSVIIMIRAPHDVVAFLHACKALL